MLDTSNKRIRRPTAGAVIGTLGLIAALGSVAYAAIPDGAGRIKGCYATSNGLLLGIPHSKGDLRTVDSTESCRSYEKTLTWNQQGPQGEQGPKGDTGPAGPEGDPGPQGPAGIGRAFAAGGTARLARFQTATLAEIGVSPGSYTTMFSAQAYASGDALPGNVFCQLTLDGENLGLVAGETPGAQNGVEGYASLSANESFTTATPRTVGLRCEYSAGGADREKVDIAARITLHQVASIN